MLPANQRQITRKRVYCWSRDKDGGHAVLSAISENPMLYANISAQSSTEPALLPIEVLRCGNEEFRALCCCHLGIYPTIFMLTITEVISFVTTNGLINYDFSDLMCVFQCFFLVSGMSGIYIQRHIMGNVFLSTFTNISFIF